MSCFRILLPTLCATLLASGALPAAAAPPAGGAPAQTEADTDVQATVTGTVTVVTPARHAFRLRPDAGGEGVEYRPYFRGGHAGDIATRISHLKVGDHLTVTYLIHEGRRALTITDAPAAHR